jgi:hypothetical protein
VFTYVSMYVCVCRLPWVPGLGLLLSHCNLEIQKFEIHEPWDFALSVGECGGRKKTGLESPEAGCRGIYLGCTHTHTNTYTHTHTRGYIHRRIVVDGRLLGAFITSWGPLLPLVTGGCLSMLGAICYYLSPGSWGILVVDWRTSNS